MAAGDKAVLLSIKPRWVSMIATGKKTVEVRKTRPKLDTPFKCYIYCSENGDTIRTPLVPFCKNIDGSILERCYIMNGKVIGGFVCHNIFPLSFYASEASFFDTEPPMDVPGTCLTDKEIVEYLGNGQTGYGWHISDLKIYDEPKELSDFKRWNRTEDNSPCAHVKSLYEPCESCKECNLTRPPQSWCYVEELL